jgi:hypothetical protein
MSIEDDDEPDEGLRRELARLPRELAPPKGLEARVVAALRERGSLAAVRPRPNPWRLGGAIAACLALLVAGIWLGRQGASRGHPLAAPSYLLILHESADFNPDRIPRNRMAAETGRWARRVLGAQHFVVGQKLYMSGWLLKSSRVAGMSPGDLQDAPDGFFLIVASSDQEALGIARSCPFLKWGGRIELRRINPD